MTIISYWMADITGDNLRITLQYWISLRLGWPVCTYLWVCLNTIKHLFFDFFLHKRPTHVIPTTLNQLHHNCKESFCSHNLELYVAPNRVVLYINHFLMEQNLYGTNFLLTIIWLEFCRENERNLNPVCSHVKN